MAPGVFEYSVNGIPAQAGTAILTGRAADPTNSLYFNGQLVPQDAPFPFALPRGPGQLPLLVVLPFPGTSPPPRLTPGVAVGYNASYSVQTLRPACAQVDSLAFEGAQAVLSPQFGPGEYRYELTVGDTVASLEVSAVLSRALPGSTLSVCGVPAASGQPVQCALPPGNGTVSVAVTSAARYGSCVTEYLLSLRRPVPARLLDIQLAPGRLEPGFDPSVYLYTLFVDPAVLLLPGALEGLVLASPGITVSLDGVFVAVNQQFPVKAAECQTLTFTAFEAGNPLGTTYRVIVTNRPTPRLDSLDLAPGTVGYLLPEYNTNDTAYVARLSSRTNGSVCYVFGVADALNLTIAGARVTPGEPQCFNATAGRDSTVVAVLSGNATCYAQTGYTLVARVSPLPFLLNLSTAPQQLSPQPFDPALNLYTVTVPFLQKFLFATATLPREFANATITMVDPATRALRLAASGVAKRVSVPLGSRSPLLVRVADGDAVRTYTVRTVRPPPISWTLAMLMDLNVTVGGGGGGATGDATAALDPAFDPMVQNYTCGVRGPPLFRLSLSPSSLAAMYITAHTTHPPSLTNVRSSHLSLSAAWPSRPAWAS